LLTFELPPASLLFQPVALLALTPFLVTPFGPLIHRTATGRAQRASARNQNGGAMPVLDPLADSEGGSTSAPPLASVDSESYTMVLDDEPSISRSNSSLNVQETPSASTSGRPRRKQDKGKGREVEPLTVRVKEEPRPVSLHSPEPAANTVR
jgi:hypothetical protein